MNGETITETSKERKIWRIQAGLVNKHFDIFREKGIIAMGWGKVGDLRKFSNEEDIAHATRKEYGRRSVFPLLFLENIKVGDLAVIKRGDEVIVGKIVSDYFYEKDDKMDDYYHRRHVEWDNEKYKLPRNIKRLSLVPGQPIKKIFKEQ